MQGGSRTSGYVRNAVLSILNNQETNCIQIGEIVATEFNPQESWVSQIVNETDRYRIHDLVSGMNAFIRYGKADMLVKYCEDMEEDKASRTRRLVDGMKQVDDAISLCDPSRLEESIRKLMQIINKKEGTEGSYVSNLFQAVEDGIKKDYEKLLSKQGAKNVRVDYLELVDWCRRKRLIQQALTIIEDKMPEIVLDKFVRIDVNRQADKLSYREYLKKLSKIFFGSSSPQGDEKNILFYGLTKKIGGLWKHDYDSRYKDDDRQNILDSYNEGKVIADRYYAYMLGNWCFQENAIDSKSSELLRNLACNETSPYKTLAGLKAGTYKLNDDEGNAIVLDIRFKVSSKRQDLEKLLLLHTALKQERNNCNHASEQRKRLPLEIVSQAISEYVESFRDLMGNR